MELLEFKTKFLDLCKTDSLEVARNKIMDVVSANNEKFYDDFLNIADNTKDWIQALWQYYEADRTDKKQDYTPRSICNLISSLMDDGDSVYDSCGGSGALTINAIEKGKAKRFVIKELDERVIPFLLFNLCLRNYEGVVINGDVLTGKVFMMYEIRSGTKYSTCRTYDGGLYGMCDSAILNPPYNIPWNPITNDERFPVVPPRGNANFAFVFNALSKSRGKVVALLPNGVETRAEESKCRKYLVDNDLVEAVINLPERMFESTSIPTCILVLNKNKANKGHVALIDSKKNCSQEERVQNGQFGSTSHTKRAYKKICNVLNDEHIEKICKAVNGIEEKEFSVIVTNEEIANNEYLLSPSRYFVLDGNENAHRPFQEIADNINYITSLKNSCKLVINETLAKSLGMDVENLKHKDDELNAQMKSIGIDLKKDDYIQFTKNKNEMCFKVNDKEIMPNMMVQFLNVWKNQIALLNTMQNNYLSELRDALLPDLMSGKIEL